MRIMIRNANIDSALPGFGPKISLFLRIKTVILRCNFICVSQSAPPVIMTSYWLNRTISQRHLLTLMRPILNSRHRQKLEN